MPPLFRVVLTGGPCGGKTTALSRISERMESLGLRVYKVPEAATMLFLNGVSLANASMDQVIAVEGALMSLQMGLEDAFIRAAQASGQPSVVICDRGTMDVSAYLPATAWQALLDEHGWSVVGLRDRRYEAVLHLVTAAKGAEAFYTTSNNAARTETPEKARELDTRLHDAWLGHPHLRVIDNSADFAGKIRRVLEAVSRVVGAPEPVDAERKYLVRSAPDPLPVRFEEVEIEQAYLVTADGSEERVRRRGQHGSFTYTHTIKRPLKAGQRVEIERPILAREYVALLAKADPARHPVRKRRRCFLWEHHYFELDRILEPRAGLQLLEVELDREGGDVPLPPWIEIDREVTSDPAYSNYEIAARK